MRKKRFPHAAILFGLAFTALLLCLAYNWPFQNLQWKDLRAIVTPGRVVLLAIAALAGVVLALWKLPRIQVDRAHVKTATERLQLENSARSTLAQAIGGVFFFLTAFFTWQQIETSRDGQLTDRFNKATEQLASGDKQPMKCVSGLYALERIANDSDGDYWTVIQLINTFVRSRCPLTDASGTGQAFPMDANAAMAVLGRRRFSLYHGEPDMLRFAGADLRHASTRRGHFEGADFHTASLASGFFEGTSFKNAYFDGADMRGVHLAEADLTSASLRRVDLREAHLGPTTFKNEDIPPSSYKDLRQLKARGYLGPATLHGANLQEARLEGANLLGVQLEGADLHGATYNENTIWPDDRFNPKEHGAVEALTP